MAAGDKKKLYFLKLPQNFFTDVTSPRYKMFQKMRKIPGGAVYQLIYVKMLLASISDEGMLFYDEVDESIAEEIAMIIGEDATAVELTLKMLKAVGLMEEVDENVFLNELPPMVSSETAVAERVRRHRANKKALESAHEEALPNDVTQKALQCNTNETQSNNDVTEVSEKCNLEYRDKSIENRGIHLSTYTRVYTGEPPTLEEMERYAREKGYRLNVKDIFDHYQERDWRDSRGEPIRDWKAILDVSHSRQRTATQVPRSGTQKRDFGFEQRNYDFEQLENMLLDY